MPYKLRLNNPNAGRGADLQIVGSEYLVSDEDARNFRTQQAALGNDRTLLESFKGDEYVTVEKMDVDKGREIKSRTAPPPPSDKVTDPGPQIVAGETVFPGAEDKKEGEK
jgi:hypothetical protein